MLRDAVAVAVILTTPPSAALSVPALTTSPGPFGTGVGSPDLDKTRQAATSFKRGLRCRQNKAVEVEEQDLVETKIWRQKTKILMRA